MIKNVVPEQPVDGQIFALGGVAISGAAKQAARELADDLEALWLVPGVSQRHGP